MAKLPAYYSRLDYFQRHLPKLEGREKQLEASIKTLEDAELKLQGEISS